MPYRQTPKLSEALVTYQRNRAINLAKSTVDNDRSVLVSGHEILPGDGHETARWRT
ncbi:MAG: hypothetical protein KKA97_12650 [Actinobacteria bacterium]|nr:hypothetical protein [Actinomycetota bacterium]